VRPKASWAGLSPNSTWLDSTRLDCVELVEQHSSTRSTRQARLARHDELDWLDYSSTRNLVCCVVCIKLFTNLMEYTLI